LNFWALEVGGRGLELEIRVLKEKYLPRSCPRRRRPHLDLWLYNIFGARAFRHFGGYPKTPKATYFWVWVRLMEFWPESPASGVEKRISGLFRASGNQNLLFYTREDFPRPGERLAHFFFLNVQNAP
jgi:hypothetical protein